MFFTVRLNLRKKLMKAGERLPGSGLGQRETVHLLSSSGRANEATPGHGSGCPSPLSLPRLYSEGPSFGPPQHLERWGVAEGDGNMVGTVLQEVGGAAGLRGRIWDKMMAPEARP